MDAGGAGWSDALTAWWFDFLDEKGGKGVSKDTWSMVCHRRPLRPLFVF
jgi:DCN1-like protein 1/2